MRDRELALTPLYWNGISQTSAKSKHIFGANQGKIWAKFKDGRAILIHLQKEWTEAENLIASKYYNDQEFFNQVKDLMIIEETKVEEFLLKISKVDFVKLGFNDLLDRLYQIRDIWLSFDEVNVPAWFWTGDGYKVLLEKDLKMNFEDFLTITTPEVQTYASQFDLDFATKALDINTGKIDLETAAAYLAEHYGWLPFGYDGLEYWDQTYFVKKLTEANTDEAVLQSTLLEAQHKVEELIAKKADILKRYKITPAQIEKIAIINQLAIWTDERKRLAFQLHYYYSQGLLELAKRFATDYKTLKYLLTEELSGLEKNAEGLIAIAKQRIEHEFVYEACDEQIRMLDQSEIDILKQALAAELQVSELKGIVASVGDKNIYQARVKIILSPTESNKIKEGDFLVATMTSPDYVISMKKATGFITDEGGVTCHAAIVAREMNKPCVIGTKNATKVLHDGDMVEVDVSTGKIKIIQKAS